MGDELARQRRELPWVRLEKSYRFVAEDGVKTLGDLFDGRSQLLIYHFMYGPDYDGGCPTCSSTADSFDGVLAHLKANDMTMICVSRAPIEQLLVYRRRMGRHFNWVSSNESDFNFDYGVSAEAEATHELASPLLEANEIVLHKMLSEQPAIGNSLPMIANRNAKATGTSVEGYFSEGHGFSTFALEGAEIYHCYSTYARGTEFLMGHYAIFDRAPKGRNEQNQPMRWLRRHDEYGT